MINIKCVDELQHPRHHLQNAFGLHFIAGHIIGVLFLFELNDSPI